MINWSSNVPAVVFSGFGVIQPDVRSMTRKFLPAGKFLSAVGIFLLISLFGSSVSAAASGTDSSASEPGAYCPGPDILLVVAEELSTSIDLVMDSRAALLDGDVGKAISDLNSAGTALRLAASRGAAARTNLLVDALIRGKAGEDYAGMLEWFPLLQSSLQTVPDNAATSAANDLIGRAEEIMRGTAKGHPMDNLRKARHMLACDDLDIPVQAAVQAQDRLMKQLARKPEPSAYDKLLDSLRSALTFALGKNS